MPLPTTANSTRLSRHSRREIECERALTRCDFLAESSRVDLVEEPGQSAWVQGHWIQLERGNCFVDRDSITLDPECARTDGMDTYDVSGTSILSTARISSPTRSRSCGVSPLQC